MIERDRAHRFPYLGVGVTRDAAYAMLGAELRSFAALLRANLGTGSKRQTLLWLAVLAEREPEVLEAIRQLEQRHESAKKAA